MRMAGLLVALGATLTILTAPSARAADECRGLQVCIPVSGPWVTIPASTAADGAPSRSWYVKCPKGSIVGGVDARLTSRAIDMSFSGRLGSPVNPGVTTTSEVVSRVRLGPEVTTGRVSHLRGEAIYRCRRTDVLWSEL